MTTFPQKVTFGELRASGVRDVLIYCRDHRCSHHIAISADRSAMPWQDDGRKRDRPGRGKRTRFVSNRNTCCATAPLSTRRLRQHSPARRAARRYIPSRFPYARTGLLGRPACNPNRENQRSQDGEAGPLGSAVLLTASRLRNRMEQCKRSGRAFRAFPALHDPTPTARADCHHAPAVIGQT